MAEVGLKGSEVDNFCDIGSGEIGPAMSTGVTVIGNSDGICVCEASISHPKAPSRQMLLRMGSGAAMQG